MKKNNLSFTNLFFLLIIFISPLLVDAQNGQDMETVKPLTVEEILMKENPNLAKTLLTKGKYLVVENVRTGKRRRFYQGDYFRFKTKDGIEYNNVIRQFTDSSFVVTSNPDSLNYGQTSLIKLKDIRVFYKYAKRKPSIALYAAPLGFLALDWAYFSKFPKDRLFIFGLLEAAIVLHGSNIFRGKKITDNFRIRMLQAY